MNNPELIPRNYQVLLMNICIQQNTIIYLPTGSGKTFITTMVLKHKGEDLLRSYSNGGKLTIILVNTVALVDQHASYIHSHTNFKVGKYSGEMNLDFWPREKWYTEYEKYQVLIMTSQILDNLVKSNYIDLNKVNLLVFDECHRGVNDHTMRSIMKQFQNLRDSPRVIGLTATLLNGNCKPTEVIQKIRNLETTYHSKVATVEELVDVIGYSTNPKEKIVLFNGHTLHPDEEFSIAVLNKTISILDAIKDDPIPTNFALKGLQPIHVEEGQKKLKNLLKDLIYHIETMGSYGGYKACISNNIRIERIKKHCDDMKLLLILNSVQTTLSFVNKQLTKRMAGISKKEQIFRFSSHKILTLLQIFQEYKKRSSEELCCIVFTQRRYTAKVIYHILDSLSKHDPEYSNIKPNFIVGHNSSPYNDTRDSLYRHKQNKQILNSLKNKDINVLVASNVLEEGVDVAKCSLVIKYDYPLDYRSYIQSKGRARHKESLYYIMVISEDQQKFEARYNGYNVTEGILNDYLIGKNDEREDISTEELQAMYNEDIIPPYYVDGPDSACITMSSAIPFLCHYCMCLPGDSYTTMSPDWHKKVVGEIGNKEVCVVILLPIGSKIIDEIEGPYMPNLKLAKRAAAFKACVLLHQAGELDSHLLPVKQVLKEEDISFLFTHYPTKADPFAGNVKTHRLHKKMIPQVLHKQIQPSSPVYLHIIQLDPVFLKQTSDINNSTLYEMYTSSLCYGIITSSPLPTLCDFPIYISAGTIQVSLKVNQKSLTITDDDLLDVKTFHVKVFDGVLEILQRFLIFDKGDNPEIMLLVPVDKLKVEIDWNVLRAKIPVNLVQELSIEEKLGLIVTPETYLHKIVNPWYRRDTPVYIVTEVCLNKTANSPFPNEDFGSFKDYFKTRHNIVLKNPNLPLLRAKGLTKSTVFIKPKGTSTGKRKHDKLHMELEEFLPPELLVKQDYPASLWIQASFLPTILSRISFMLQLEELRCRIINEMGLSKQNRTGFKKPLQLDEYLLTYEPYIEDPQVDIDTVDGTLAVPSSSVVKINKEFTNKIIESQYPWKDIEEPIDIERSLNVTIMDIEHYETFLGCKLSESSRELKNTSPVKHKPLALTYHKNFVPTKIKLLEIQAEEKSPELCEFFRAFTCAKANEIVNLERLETLGDSFLKYISSVYIFLRFPQYGEGRATSLKGRLVSNRNLFYLAMKKNLNGVIKYNELSPKNEWLPPAFTIPQEMLQRIDNKELSLSAVFGLNVPLEEQISGDLSEETKQEILDEECPQTDNEECNYQTMSNFLKRQYIGDKYISDVVESLIGAYLKSGGIRSGIRIIEWIGIIPKSEKLENLLRQPSPSPLLKEQSELEVQNKIRVHLPLVGEIEEIIGYKFKNKAYLLQALTHSSYTPNRTTLSYEKLEYIGDAVLDFLITCHIFDTCENLDPGQLTDLRSALVNNNTFASLVVRMRLHTYLLMMNMQLQKLIDKFDTFMNQKNYVIDDEVLILLQEDEYQLAESVDVPKVLGDIFEAIAGAIYLDSGKNLGVVWDVFYKIMWKEIDLFSSNIPKNVIRKLFEWTNAHAKFGQTAPTDNNKTMIPLHFLLDGIPSIVHGFGTNKAMAKKAAAKLALQLLLERKSK